MYFGEPYEHPTISATGRVPVAPVIRILHQRMGPTRHF
jgi:hypothetical protein